MNTLKLRTSWWLCIAVVILTATAARPAEHSRIARFLKAAAGRTSEDSESEGKQLFLQQFLSGPQEEGGDGLGPLFNHVSCAACHHQGTLGGGGGIEFNVALLCAQLDGTGSRPNKNLLIATLEGLHPAFVPDGEKIVPNILLHRFGPGERYFQFKLSLGGQSIPMEPSELERQRLLDQLARQPLPTVKVRNHVRLVRAQRNTTALFGAGLIDKIPDDVLFELAASQAAQGEVSGRVPPIGPDKVGRFGWRGQQEHLHDFVLGACANELGLQVPGNAQPMDPLRPKYQPVGLDLSAEQCRSLTAFVASLPAPQAMQPLSRRQRNNVTRGRQLFATVGCAACHAERVGDIDGIYSDLLLHDMGPGLADPVLAQPTLVLIKQRGPAADDQFATSVPRLERPQAPPQPPVPNMYYGGSTFQSLALTGPPAATVEITDPKTGIRGEYRAQPTTLESEWRTPPLWGVASSAPYLHDGRAATLIEAILLHGGEADRCVQRFRSLEADERMSMVAFLQSLEAHASPF